VFQLKACFSVAEEFFLSEGLVHFHFCSDLNVTFMKCDTRYGGLSSNVYVFYLEDAEFVCQQTHLKS
jgi:hypothetical protein